MSTTFVDNPSYLAYERALVRLQELTSAQQDDSAEAVLLRDTMDGPWNTLSAEERRHLKGLSADLYMIDGKEIVRHRASASEAAEWLHRLEELVKQEDWDGVLSELRVRPESFSDAHVAYLRGRAYGELGELDAASAFFDHAHRLEPENAAAAIFALNAHEHAGHWDRAASLARSYLRTPDRFDPKLVVTAAAVLQSAVDKDVAVEEAESLHREVLEAVREALKPRPAVVLTQAFAVLAHVLIAHAAFSLGDLRTAEGAYSEALRLDSGDAELYSMRGQIRARLDQAEALEDFENAVALATTSAVPYAFLAQRCLRKSDYRRAVELSERVLTLTENPRLRAEALQYLAIAKTELGQPTTIIRAVFERAIALDPSNPTLLGNYDAFQRRRTQRSVSKREREWVLVAPRIPPLEDQMLRQSRRGVNDVQLAVAG